MKVGMVEQNCNMVPTELIRTPWPLKNKINIRYQMGEKKFKHGGSGKALNIQMLFWENRRYQCQYYNNNNNKS